MFYSYYLTFNSTNYCYLLVKYINILVGISSTPIFFNFVLLKKYCPSMYNFLFLHLIQNQVIKYKNKKMWYDLPMRQLYNKSTGVYVDIKYLYVNFIISMKTRTFFFSLLSKIQKLGRVQEKSRRKHVDLKKQPCR